jgi:outer membrane protein assembly factor BamB
VLGNTVYFPTSDGTRFKALDAATGNVKFDIGNKAVSFSSPAIAAGTVYYGTSDGVLHAISATDGRIVADFRTDGNKTNGSKYTDAEGKMSGALLYTERTLDGIMVGLDRMFSMGSIISSPVLRNGVLYVGSADGNLYALR